MAESATPWYAWSLLPDHFHLLLKTGKVPVATVMRRLLAGYVKFDRRHGEPAGRAGKAGNDPNEPNEWKQGPWFDNDRVGWEAGHFGAGRQRGGQEGGADRR